MTFISEGVDDGRDGHLPAVEDQRRGGDGDGLRGVLHPDLDNDGSPRRPPQSGTPGTAAIRPLMANKISAPGGQSQRRRGFPEWSPAYCTKKTAASSISAGKATRPSDAWTRRAASGRQRRNRAPAAIGRKSRTIFWTSSFPAGRSIAASGMHGDEPRGEPHHHAGS